ncbi:response regulator [Alginatibacterium sediminis]|uniref:Response regulator n=1 Tax=Alginatibacterium sediminis TaxID=2164068 RepID=A0A420E697_9ALTE|nr:sigma 54-interacting transcriptional regulator [Alginatibacterium sediminis]RKF13314.1 response regulator [Alginatibacterium sediminis]
MTINSKGHVLVVDDDPSLLRLISIRLQSAGYEVSSVASAKHALAQIESQIPSLLISDVCMSGMDGLELFAKVKKEHPHLPVILLTAHGSIPDAVRATEKGVFGYLTKPFDSKVLLDKVADAVALSVDPNRHETAKEQSSWRNSVITQSPLMLTLLSEAKQVAKSDVSVMLHGQSGTGKELFAKAIHQASPRASGPFIAVNCAAIPHELFESELFGYQKGAFTGAYQAQQGLFEAAKGGTLFLDEIADTQLNSQAKLLRALQEREIRRLGSQQSTAIDVRVIAASHQDLASLVKQRLFREDLYYRLNVVELDLPRLASRCEDIPLLVEHFANQFAVNHNVPARHYSSEAMSLLVSADWPGNVRQLMNVVERTQALSTESFVALHLVQNALKKESELSGFNQARDDFERGYLARVLRLTQGNVSQAAKIAQRNRTDFYKLLERHHLKADAFRVTELVDLE